MQSAGSLPTGIDSLKCVIKVDEHDARLAIGSFDHAYREREGYNPDWRKNEYLTFTRNIRQARIVKRECAGSQDAVTLDAFLETYYGAGCLAPERRAEFGRVFEQVRRLKETCERHWVAHEQRMERDKADRAWKEAQVQELRQEVRDVLKAELEQAFGKVVDAVVARRGDTLDPRIWDPMVKALRAEAQECLEHVVSGVVGDKWSENSAGGGGVPIAELAAWVDREHAAKRARGDKA